MTDAICYESHIRFPADVKLLWKSQEWLYRHICLYCRDLDISKHSVNHVANFVN